MKHLNILANDGTLAGLIASLLFVVLGMAGVNPFDGATLGIAVIPVVFIVAGTKKIREEENQVLTFGTAFRSGLFIAFFYASLYAILVYLYLNFFGGNLVEETKNTTIDRLELVEGKMPVSLYNKAIESAENISAGALALSRYWNNLIWGVLISLTTSFIFRKNPDPFSSSENQQS